MKSKRRTETIIETHEFWVVKRPRGGAGTWCRECADPARMLWPEQAAKLVGVSTRTIYRWVEAGRVHFAEAADGSVTVCLATLPGGLCDASPPSEK